MNHQIAIGRPTHIRMPLNVRKAFMYVGGSVGPPGTRVKYGPVIHRIHTYSWSTRSAPPIAAQIGDRLYLRVNFGPERSRAAERFGDSGPLLVRQIAHAVASAMNTAVIEPPPVVNCPGIYQWVSKRGSSI